jgi:hypothetical protein
MSIMTKISQIFQRSTATHIVKPHEPTHKAPASKNRRAANSNHTTIRPSRVISGMAKKPIPIGYLFEYIIFENNEKTLSDINVN